MDNKLYIFDFDDTLVQSTACVTIYHADNSVSRLNSSEFAHYDEKPGDSFDFMEFEIYPPQGKTIPLTFEILQKLAIELGPRHVIILTARGLAQPVKQFLKDQGLQITIPVIAVGNSHPSAKAAYVAKRLCRGNYSSVHVYEDNHKNIKAIQNVVKKMGIEFNYTLINMHKKSSDKCENLRKYIRHILVEEKNNKKDPSAGIIVVRKFANGLKVLGLSLYGKYDIPKGKIESGESVFEAAMRETYEETGITDLSFPYGLQSITSGHVTVYIGKTSRDPIIRQNPQTGIFEHHGASWLNWDELILKVYPHLRPLIIQAEKIITSH